MDQSAEIGAMSVLVLPENLGPERMIGTMKVHGDDTVGIGIKRWQGRPALGSQLAVSADRSVQARSTQILRQQRPMPGAAGQETRPLGSTQILRQQRPMAATAGQETRPLES